MVGLTRCTRWLAGRCLSRRFSVAVAVSSRQCHLVPLTTRGQRELPALTSSAQLGHCSLSTQPADQRKPTWQVEQVTNNSAAGSVDLSWTFGEVTQFPYVWLRDCCLCPECYHPTSLSRQMQMDKLDVNITPKHVQNDSTAQELVVTWTDDHNSRYPHSWLAERTFTTRQLKQRKKEHDGPRSVLWNRATIEHNLFKVDYKHVMDDLNSLHDTLHHLQSYGLLVVQNCPLHLGVVEKVCNRLGHTRMTHYGKTFTVDTKLNANNVAYTSNTLAPHLDQPFYEYVPGVQLLHCINQHVGAGGDNILGDSFYVAELIRQQRPDLFHLLSSTSIEFDDIGVEDETQEERFFHKVQEHPMFKLDAEGNVVQVCFNNAVRSYRLNVPFKLVKHVYEGLKLFYNLSLKKENNISYKMSNGDMLVFNNRRVTHGRLGFTVTQDCNRLLEGAYIDWDEITCRYRATNDLLNKNPVALR